MGWLNWALRQAYYDMRRQSAAQARANAKTAAHAAAHNAQFATFTPAERERAEASDALTGITNEIKRLNRNRKKYGIGPLILGQHDSEINKHFHANNIQFTLNGQRISVVQKGFFGNTNIGVAATIDKLRVRAAAPTTANQPIRLDQYQRRR